MNAASEPAVRSGTAVVGIVLAFAVIYVIWGTTYLAITLSLQTLPPFTSGAIRFLAAGLLMLAWLLVRNRRLLAQVPLRTAMLAGLLLSGVGNGLVVFAQQGVPSGIAALVVSSIPGIVLLLDALFFSRRRPAMTPLAGVVIALAGVGLLASGMRSLTDRAEPLFVIALLCAAAGWSLGTLIQQRGVTGPTVLAFTCIQMLAGGTFQLFLAGVTGEGSTFDLHSVSLTSWLAVAYLVVFGSIVAFNCYLWLLTQVPAPAVTTYALVNPVIALVLGWIVLGERITPLALIAAMLVLSGVALVLFHGVWPRIRAALLR